MILENFITRGPFGLKETKKFVQDQDDEILVDVIEQIKLSDERLMTSITTRN
jgi:hypothetical protein